MFAVSLVLVSLVLACAPGKLVMLAKIVVTLSIVMFAILKIFIKNAFHI